MLTRAEISELMAFIAEEHPKFLDTPNPEHRLDLWEEAFKNMPYDLVDFAVKRTLIESPYAPRLSDVAQRIKEIVRPEGDSAVAAWNALRKAVSRASVVTREEFETLPPEVQRFCGSLNGLRSLGMLNEDIFSSVTRGQFMKVYDGMRRSRETMELMPPKLRDITQNLTKQLPDATALNDEEFEKRRQGLMLKVLGAQGEEGKP